MHLYLHPTRPEALTASDTALTRWSLENNPATILAQMPTSPLSVFSYSYDQGGRLHASGGVTGTPDGVLFALEELWEECGKHAPPCEIEWRYWDDFSLARSRMYLGMYGGFDSLASSPDGRWLVLESAQHLNLLDWQTGEILSRHAVAGYATAGLTFDPTSTFVAGCACHDNWGHLMLWQVVPVERFLPRPQGQQWWAREAPPDQVMGRMALQVIHWELDRTGIAWPDRDLADTACQAAFSPDSRVVIFSPMNSAYSGCGMELVAYEVPSGKRLWCARSKEENTGDFVIAPDGSIVLVPVQGGDLLVYRVEDGALVARMPTNLSEPVQALTFDHDGRTLWLATEETLVQYQPQG